MSICCMDYYNDGWDIDMQPGSLSTQLCNLAFISLGTFKWYCMVSDLICHFIQPEKIPEDVMQHLSLQSNCM